MAEISVQNKAPIRTISASRRTDMAASNPQLLTARLEEKAPPETTHTVVLWTKNPYNLLYNKKLYSQLLRYDQLYLQLCVTGLGGTTLEPKVPPPEKTLSLLPKLLETLFTPERITIRFDPIVHFQMADGSVVNNLKFFDFLAPILSEAGIKKATTSWVQIYGKVARRLQKLGINVIVQSEKEHSSEAAWLRRRAKKYDIDLQGCCVPGWPQSSCIDGAILNRQHPRGEKTSTRRAKGQRALCGCTESLDIGWYHACIHGCVYCYGNPQHYNVDQDGGIRV